MISYYLITVPNGQSAKKFIVTSLDGLTGKFPLFFVEKIDLIYAKDL